MRSGHAPGNDLACEFHEHAKRVTAPYKHPRQIEFVDDLPKTRGGKIRRVELRKQEERAPNGRGARPKPDSRFS